MNDGEINTLQNTINLLDDNEIDFYIYAKKKLDLKAKYSNLYFVGKKNKINNQNFDELVEEKTLITESLKGDYDYFHLISSMDFPLMTKDYFKEYFSKMPIKIGFVEKIDNQDYHSVSYYYPLNNFNYKKTLSSFLFVRICMAINHIFHVERSSSENVLKGCPYFSLPRKYVMKLDEKNIEKYSATINSKDFFAQTTLEGLKKNNPPYTIYSSRFNLTMAYKDSARYANYLKTEKINWFDENPYVFSINDKDELQKVINTDYAFAHVVRNADELISLFEK